MRSRLLDAASALFKTYGLNGTSVTAIAGAADAFPSQVTYYFRTKEALFVEAACRDMLHIAERKTKESGFQPPLDIVDGAARIVDPIFDGINTGRHVWGQFLKDYRPTAW